MTGNEPGGWRVWAAQRLGAPAVRLLGRSLRISRQGVEYLEAARREGPGNVILAIWHAHMILIAYLHEGWTADVLVSEHRDGEIIARVLHGFGYGTVRGSTTRGGLRALYGLVRAARRGLDLAVTPDGPRGPAYAVQPGIITLSALSGVPIVPVVAAGPSDWRLDSWDRFRIARPFSRILFAYGLSLTVPRRAGEEEREAIRRQLESRLLALSRKAEGEDVS